MIKYFFSFKGRINRLKYASGIIPLQIIGYLLGNSCKFAQDETICIFVLIFFILIYWMIFALTVKRLHDIGRNGWWSLLIIIPIISLFLELRLLFIKGIKGINKFGEDPLYNNLDNIDYNNILRENLRK